MKIQIVALMAGRFAGALTSTVRAEEISLRIGSGHPPGVVYAGLMKSYFQTEVQKRVVENTEHTINFVEGYSGSIVKVTDEDLVHSANAVFDKIDLGAVQASIGLKRPLADVVDVHKTFEAGNTTGSTLLIP